MNSCCIGMISVFVSLLLFFVFLFVVCRASSYLQFVIELTFIFVQWNVSGLDSAM